MSEHVLDWIGAYHDGELHGDRLREVEAHLRTCAACQAELGALQDMSARLQASAPMPTRTPPEQFVAQVRLRLAPHDAPVPGQQRLRRAAGLWLPLGVLALWAAGQAVLTVTGLALSVAALSPAGPPALPPPQAAEGALLLAALVPPASWGGWLTLLALNVSVTTTAAVLAWGCLAGWWAAQERESGKNTALSGEPVG